MTTPAGSEMSAAADAETDFTCKQTTWTSLSSALILLITDELHLHPFLHHTQDTL